MLTRMAAGNRQRPRKMDDIMMALCLSCIFILDAITSCATELQPKLSSG